MDRIPTFMLSTNPSYNYTGPSGSVQEIQGVKRDGANIYCLENDITATMMGDMSESVVLSKEACEAHVGAAEEGRIPENFVEQWGLDLPDEMADHLPDAREMADEVGIPAVDNLEAKAPEASSSKEAAKPDTQAEDKTESKPEDKPESKSDGKAD